MIPALMAARPLIKYGLLIGVPVALFLGYSWFVYFKGYRSGEADAAAACQAELAKQVNETNKQVVVAKEMESKIVRGTETVKLEIQKKATAIRKKVIHETATPPIQLTPEFVRLYDELRGVPNTTAAPRLPAADPGAGASQVPSGEIRPPSAGVVQVEPDEGEAIELTTDELKQAVVDAYIKLAEAKNDYSGLSRWNDGREELEILRLRGEEP